VRAVKRKLKLAGGGLWKHILHFCQVDLDFG
jgi:hypothetical protein